MCGWALRRSAFHEVANNDMPHDVGELMELHGAGGESSDFKGYMPVMDTDGPAPKVLLADKGYDADFIRTTQPGFFGCTVSGPALNGRCISVLKWSRMIFFSPGWYLTHMSQS